MLYKKLKNLEERKNLPLNGPSNYKVDNNIIYTKAFEINATYHCNLSCNNCSHSSPIMPKHEYEISKLKKELSTLKKFLRCEIVRIVGGEPLLHSNLKEMLETIKKSNISDKICLVTNGVLLNSTDPSLFDYIDELEVSLYPLKEELRNKIKNFVESNKNKFSKVRILEYDNFRIPFVKQKNEDKQLIEKIYNTCQIAHYWRCISIENGYIFRCPQSMINAVRTGDYSDGIKINDIKNINDVLDFFENNNPISYCYKCLGSVGKMIKHEQVNKNIWNEKIPDEIESSIDYNYMKEINDDYKSNMKCANKKIIK